MGPGCHEFPIDFIVWRGVESALNRTENGAENDC